MKKRAFFVGILLLSCIHGCEQRESLDDLGNSDKSIPNGPAGVPFVFIYVTPAYSEEIQPGGVLLAIWKDGKIIRAKTEADLGKSYIKGRLTGDQLMQVRRILAKSGVLQTPRSGGLIVDARAEWLVVRWGRTVRAWTQNPDFDATPEKTTKPRMNTTKLQLLSIVPEESAPEPSEAWTKYPHDWLK